jgi:hypothetical protein
MAGLVCLYLKAAPGYISSRSFRLPSTSSIHWSPLHTLFYTILSSPSLKLLTSPMALATIPSFMKTLQVYFLLAILHIYTTTLQLGSILIPPLPTFFTLFLSKALDLEHSIVPMSSPCPQHWLQSPPLQSTLKVYSLLAAFHISTTPLQLDYSTLHTTVDSWSQSTIISSGYINAKALYSINPASLFKTSSLLSLPPHCLTLGGRHPCCHWDFFGLYKIMAPTIQVLAACTFNILENILKKHTNTNQILKEREKQILSREDY